MDAFVERDDARIAYSVAGDEQAPRTLVVAHALTSSRAYDDAWGVFDWSPVADGGERVVRYDARGHGASTETPTVAQHRWEALAGDLHVVADAVSAELPVDGLGVSAGCGVLLWAAVQAPNRFRRLVLVIPPPAGAARAQQGSLYAAAAELVELRGLDAWIRAAETLTPAPILAAGGWTRSATPAVSGDTLIAGLRGDAASDYPADEALRALPHPVLVLAWATDPSHPLDAAERVAALLPHARLEVATVPDDIRGWGLRVRGFLSAGAYQTD